MALCQGCQEFRNSWFDLGPDHSKRVKIHESYTELSKCAETCGLCQYFRRELWFCRYDDKNYKFRDEHFRGIHRNISIMLRCIWGNSSLKTYHLFFGDRSGYSRCFERNDNVSTSLQIREGHPSIESLLDLSRSWLTTCCIEHKKCDLRVGSEAGNVPTRLLDVGKLSQQAIKLVVSRDLAVSEAIEYFTLSYRWGTMNDAACTTRDNMEERLQGIPLITLPKTLRDAVHITRTFGIKYLWIDALCIIQAKDGGNEDWQGELLNMGKIYKHSLLTIAASGATDSGVGCFYRREAAQWTVRDYNLFDERQAQEPQNPVIMEATLPRWDKAVENSVLSKRGWVLQGRMTACRTLFWTEDGLFWECSERRTSEYGAMSKSVYEYPNLSEVVRGLGNDSSISRRAWPHVLENYSTKALTVVTDRLPAIRGLGAEVAKLTGKEFAMGVFKDNLLYELAWMPCLKRSSDRDTSHSQAARLPRTPSWSWESTNQQLGFRPYHFIEICEEMATHLSLHERQIHGRGRLGSLRIEKQNGKSYIHGLNDIVSNKCVFTPVRHDTDGAKPELHEQDFAIFDTVAEIPFESGGIINCIQWMRWETNSPPGIMGKENNIFIP